MDTGEIPLDRVYSNTKMTGASTVSGAPVTQNRIPNNSKKSHDPYFYNHTPPGWFQNARRI
jgi:hypothetical protein